MTFALIIYAQSMWALPTIIHGYIDKDECERAATFLNDTRVNHACIPEHYSK